MNAVAKTNQQAVAETTSRAASVVAYFTEREKDFQDLMPPSVKVETFLRIFKNALIKDPKIAEASTSSLFAECQKCAQDGLVLDGKEAALTRFNVNKKKQVNGQWVDNWQVDVVYIPMIKGLKKLVAKSANISNWFVGVVYKNEIEQGRFRLLQGDSPSVHHEPIIDGPRGDLVAAYSAARLHDGSLSVEVMTREEVLSIKGRTKSRKTGKNREQGEIIGPWATDEAEMWRKTVARRHFKSLPLEGAAMDAVERVDSLYDFTRQPTGEFSVDDAPPTRAVANKKTKSAAATLSAAADADNDHAQSDETQAHDDGPVEHDPQTGEVLEGEILEGDHF